MNKIMAAALLAALTFGATAGAKTKPAALPETQPGELGLYQSKGYNGGEYIVEKTSSELKLDWGVRSLAVHPGEHWMICLKPRFKEPCVEVKESLPDTSVIGLTGGLGSAKMIPATR
jgi:hypothetical protein